MAGYWGCLTGFARSVINPAIRLRIRLRRMPMPLNREAMTLYMRERRRKLSGPGKQEIYQRLVVVEAKVEELRVIGGLAAGDEAKPQEDDSWTK
jgi:hypothetical protein